MARAGVTTDRLTAAAAAMADEVGIDKVTLSALARQFGVKDASLYSHVGSLRELRVRIALVAADEVAARIGGAVAGRAGKDALVAFANAYRDYALEHPGRYEASQMRFEPEEVADSEGFRRNVELTYGMLRAYGLTEPDLTDAGRLLRSTFHGYIHLELSGAFGHSREVRASWSRGLDALHVLLDTWPRTPAAGTLAVPGARLYYERRGSGPVLLMIPGGAGDAGLYAGMAPGLAERFTVVSYDPRGLSRSPLDGPAGDQRTAEWADDAYRLLEVVSPDRPAYVLGSSSGAIVALELLARHPGRVRRVVAHEPPLVEVLADPAPHRALFAEVREIFRARGAAPAMARFSEGLGGTPGEQPTEVAPEIREMAPRMHANLPFFLDRMLCPFTSSVPDLDALRKGADRLVMAVGADSRDQVPLSGPAARLAEALGTELAEFPGGHLGATEHPREFAARLVELLDA